MSLESIIEKIEKAKADDSEVDYNYALDKAIEVIKESDKPFNPENFDFKLHVAENGYKNFHDKNEKYELFQRKNKKWIIFEKASGKELLINAQIKTNHQAEIIFRALGIV